MISSFFYNIIIAPIYDLLEFSYVFFSGISSNGVAVIALSFVVTLLCLPLYVVAEKWQEEERKLQTKMKPGIERIKSTFKGDEQYMIMNVFYKQNHYHPIMALRSSFSLLIQIPFFIAAYSFLSNVESLEGYKFLFIQNMGASDSMFHIGNFTVNVLPVAMTLINCVAGFIYSRGHDKREQIQIYACAAIFLLILYDSPAGLVLYWTMNNVLSLVKNVFYKIKNPIKVLHFTASICMVLALIFSIYKGKMVYLSGSVILLCTVVFYRQIYNFFDYLLNKFLSKFDSEPKKRAWFFYAGAISLALFTGAVLPSFVIESSPANFCYVDFNKSPMVFLITPLLQCTGLFLFWPACLYHLFSSKFKRLMAILMPLLFIISVLNCFIFPGSYGAMNDDLTFMHEVVFPSAFQIIINFVIILILCTFVGFLFWKKDMIIRYALIILTISLSAVGIKNISIFMTTFKNMNHEEISEIEPIFKLSKTKPNVMVIMQDRCISGFLPEVFEESPELKLDFEGFTYYPNTISMSYYTQLGVPGIFGGYDFTPFEMNKRTELTIQQKHNQAILTMPKLFSDAGYHVTVSDIPYENYGEEPVKQIYSKIPNLTREVTKGYYTKLWYEKQGTEPYPVLTMLLKRNFLYLSIFKIVSPVFRPIVYHRSWWIKTNSKMKYKSFMDCYVPLAIMNDLTSTDSEESEFILLVNELTHEPIMLQAPEYKPSENITNTGKSIFSSDSSYHAAVCAMKRWGEFFNYLKENNVYDNTRIVIVSDHGAGSITGKFGPYDKDGNKLPFIKEEVTATLLVKDFNAHGLLKTSDVFMSNADTPAIAVKNIIQDAKNPFTGNPLEIENKEDFIKIAYAPVENLRSRDNRQYKVKNTEWFTVKENIYNDKNWSRLK